MPGLFFDDFQVGQRLDLGAFHVTREEIIAFARQFDPQPFHLDEEAARRSPFGGLIASGWHTASLCMRQVVDSVLGPGSGSLGSSGIDELRWLKPVRPGDDLRVAAEVLEITPSCTRPERGKIRVKYSVTNQGDELVMTMVGIGLFSRRERS